MLSSGRIGRAAGPAGVFVAEEKNLALFTVAARRQCEADLNNAIFATFGLRLPGPLSCATVAGQGFMWCGPNQWLAFSANNRKFEQELHQSAVKFASFVDQSDSRIVLRLFGTKIRDALSKGLSLDLHPTKFRTGSAHVAVIAHIRVEFWQTADSPVYWMAVPRSYFLCYWSWLVSSASEFGMDIRG
jgi:sarcosine oxidase subunit gamma